MRITFLNQKGGVGKTTVALLIGAVLQKAAGYDVAIEDLDRQGTAKFFAKNFGLPLLAERPNAAYVLTDTPGHLLLESDQRLTMSHIISNSDKIILVTEKSPASIHATVEMATLIRELVLASDEKSAIRASYVLFNKVRVLTVIGQQDASVIAEPLGLPALRNEIPLASVYERALLTGLTGVTGERRALLVNLALEILK